VNGNRRTVPEIKKKTLKTNSNYGVGLRSYTQWFVNKTVNIHVCKT